MSRTNNHRLIAWLERDIGRLRDWPIQIRRILTRNKHPNNTERYAFFCFLYGNFHYDPDFIVNLMLDTWNFDRQATASLRETAKSFRAGRKNYSYINVSNGRWARGV